MRRYTVEWEDMSTTLNPIICRTTLIGGVGTIEGMTNFEEKIFDLIHDADFTKLKIEGVCNAVPGNACTIERPNGEKWVVVLSKLVSAHE